MTAVLTGFIAYLVIVLFIGLLTAKQNKTQADYLIGGRKLNPWVIAFSERASGESAWLLLGMTGAALSVGLGETWTALGCVLGIIFSWLFIARRLREDSGKYDALTLPEYFTQKFAKDSKSIQIIASVIIIFFFTFYVAAQFSGAGKVLNVTFGIPNFWGVLIGAGVILLYTMLGGFFAVAWTDLVQGIIMLGTLVILPIVGVIELSEAGKIGTLSISQALAQQGADKASWVGGALGLGAVLFVINGLSWGLGYTGQPHLVLRYIAMRNPSDAKKATKIAIVWAVLAFTGSLLIGLVGLGLYGANEFGDPEKLMPIMATRLLPVWLAGIFISGAIAAMMSTADSQILVATSAVTEDIYHRVMGKNPSQKTLVLISRVATLAIGLAALVLALTTKELVFSMVSYAWGGLGASFGPIIVLSLYWRKLNKQGVIAGMLAGSLTTFVWKNISTLQSVVPERLAGYVVALFAVIIVTLATKPKSATADR